MQNAAEEEERLGGKGGSVVQAGAAPSGGW